MDYLTWYRLCQNTMLVIFALISSSSTLVSGNLNANQVIVEFDPYVSILDKANRSRYDVTYLQILIAKVATKFSKIYIEFTDAHLELMGTSLLQSPAAAASYNCDANTPHKIEVWLGLHRESSDQINAESLSRILSIANNTNKLCNGTVTNVLISQMISPVESTSIRNRSWFQSKNSNLNDTNKDNIYVGLGIIFSFPFDCDEHLIDHFAPNLVIFRKASYVSNNSEINIIDNCKGKFINKNKSIEFGVMNGYSDTMSDNILNTTGLVSSWIDAIKYASKSKNFVILSRAFDTPYKNSTEEQTMGWWRVSDNCMYTSEICQNNYVAKSAIAEYMDGKENPKNYYWLNYYIKFNSNTTGLIFYDSEITELIKTSDLTYMLIRNENFRIIIIEEYIPTPGRMTSGNTKYKVIKDGESLLYEIDDDSILLNPYGKGSTYNRHLRKNLQKNDDFSYSFDSEMCEYYTAMEPDQKGELLRLLGNAGKQLFVFHFKEDSETVKLGARRMSEQRIVLFQQCKRMLIESGNRKTEIGFLLFEYPKPLRFFESPWALQNVVLYWKILSEWASKQSNVIIFLPAVDQERGSGLVSLGWWTPRPHPKPNENYTVTLVDKQRYALHISKLRYPEIKPKDNSNMTVITQTSFEKVFLQNTIYKNVNHNTTIHTSGLNRSQIALIIACGLALCGITVICSSILIGYYYKQKALSNDEIDEFFNGNSSVEIIDGETSNKAPYDKVKFEIDEKNFSIDGENVLGAGEFGKVLQGKVDLPSGNINVAVKTTNPQTNHVSTLKGLLSEVKLLAYIGKHQNIIELIGANTADIKNGRIWIFLELCELGSLQKYIRSIREPTSFTLVKYSVDDNAAEMSNQYTDCESGQNKLVDGTAKNDLYRWATEICCGMEYLAGKHVVHADLATRNVLLSLSKEAKICDFGLSRRMYNYSDYVKTGQEPLPWKWMAPESLRFQHFNEKSDVWSFGITLWELYSLGETPYQGLSWDHNFANLLDRGLRPAEPAFNDWDMYQLMLNCWNGDPEQRPSFSELWEILTAGENTRDELNKVTEMKTP